MTSDPNPVVINISNISNILGNSTNFTAYRIPIAAFNLTNDATNVTVDDINISYAGGNKTIFFRMHDALETLTQIYQLVYHTSSFNRVLPYTWTDNVFFLPRTNNSKNISAYGQTPTVPLYRINTTNYDGKLFNLSISVNQTYSCLNLSWNGTGTEPVTGQVINTTPQEVGTNFGYLNNQSVWIWADLDDCDPTDPRILNPRLDFESYCINCLWSEA